MKLACADFSWPGLRHPFVLDLIAELGFEGVDIGLMSNYSAVTPEQVRQNVPLWAGILRERLETRGLEIADVFGIPAMDLVGMSVNNPDPVEQERSAAFFRDLLELAVLLGARGMTILPGTLYGNEPWEAAVRRSAEGLRWRVDEAAARGVRLSIEGHVGSHVDTPEKLAQLLEMVPGLELTLDYGHFKIQGIADVEVEPLLARARHFHCRGGVAGKVQARFKENTIDFGRVIERMRANGYDGYFAIEYVHDERPGCSECDNIQEIMLFRDFARSRIAALDRHGG